MRTNRYYRNAGLGVFIILVTLMFTTAYASGGAAGVEVPTGKSGSSWWQFWGPEPGQDETQILPEEHQELASQLR